jgi:ribonuclease T2
LKDGGERGCLISNGKWYNTFIGSSCATFRAHESDGGVRLRSSKGPCGVRGEEFTCGSGVSFTPFKLVDGRLMAAKGAGAAWSAAGVPHGTEQQSIQASSGGEVGIEILWKIKG